MIRNSLAPAIILLGAALLVAQSPGRNSIQPGTPSAPAGTDGEGTPEKKGTGSLGGSTNSSTTGTSSGTTPSSKKPEPGSLEDLIDKALKNNADIRAAEAKVREAEAELNRVRHQIVAKVATLKHDITTAKKLLEFAEKHAAVLSESYRRGTTPQSEIQPALAAVEKQKADLARLETEMQSLTGAWKNVIGSIAFTPDGRRLAVGDEYGTVRLWDATTGKALNVHSYEVWTIDFSGSVQTPMADRIRAALDKVVKIEESREELPLKEAIDYCIRKSGVDVPFRFINPASKSTTQFMKAELPLGAWLQVFEDSDPQIRFVIRDYGILVTSKERIPDGAVTVQAFWKRGDKPKTDGPRSKTP